LAFYLMMQPLSRRALASTNPLAAVTVRSFLPGFVMGIVQSALAVLVVTQGIGIEPVNLWGLVGMMMLTSVTFVALNQALVALLGAPGRFIGLMMIVLQLSAAGGTYPIQTAPSFFQAIHSWLPLTYAVESFRSLIAGGDIGIARGIWVLFAWMVGALLVTTLAAFKARRSSTPPLEEQPGRESRDGDNADGVSTSDGNEDRSELIPLGASNVGASREPGIDTRS
jgi:putative membrane protein